MGFFLIFAFLVSANAQTDSIRLIKKYRVWSISAGSVMYFPANIERTTGNYSISNYPIWSFTGGLEFRLLTLSRFNFSTGIFTILDPIYNIGFDINAYDTYGNIGEIDERAKEYNMYSFSFPFKISYDIYKNNNLNLSAFAGISAKYMLSSEGLFIITMINSDSTEASQIFGLKAFSPNQLFHGSILLGAGIALPRNKVRWSADLVCNINFKPLMSGEYLFDNLRVSPRSSGKYTLSGNYIGLVLRMNLIKSKKKSNS